MIYKLTTLVYRTQRGSTQLNTIMNDAGGWVLGFPLDVQANCQVTLSMLFIWTNTSKFMFA